MSTSSCSPPQLMALSDPAGEDFTPANVPNKFCLVFSGKRYQNHLKKMKISSKFQSCPGSGPSKSFPRYNKSLRADVIRFYHWERELYSKIIHFRSSHTYKVSIHLRFSPGEPRKHSKKPETKRKAP